MHRQTHHLVTFGPCGGNFTRNSIHQKVHPVFNSLCYYKYVLDCFAPIFTPANCAEQAAAVKNTPAQEWLHQDTPEAAERRWLENVPDYMNKDKFDKIQAHIENEINKDTFYWSFTLFLLQCPVQQ